MEQQILAMDFVSLMVIVSRELGVYPARAVRYLVFRRHTHLLHLSLTDTSLLLLLPLLLLLAMAVGGSVHEAAK